MDSNRIILAVILLTLVFLLWYLNKIHYLEIDRIVYFLQSQPIIAPFIFIVLHALFIVSIFIPTLPMTLAAGFIWGGFWGGIISIAGGSLGASAAFFISRYLAYEYFSNKLRNGEWSRLYEMINNNDWKIIVFARVNIAFPFGIGSYLFGLTEISFMKHLITTALAVAPLTFVFTSIASSIGGFILNQELRGLLNDLVVISFGVIITAAAYLIFGKYFSRKRQFGEK